MKVDLRDILYIMNPYSDRFYIVLDFTLMPFGDIIDIVLCFN